MRGKEHSQEGIGAALNKLAGNEPSGNFINDPSLTQALVKHRKDNHGDNREVSYRTCPHLVWGHDPGDNDQREKQDGGPVGVYSQPQIQRWNGYSNY